MRVTERQRDLPGHVETDTGRERQSRDGEGGQRGEDAAAQLVSGRVWGLQGLGRLPLTVASVRSDGIEREKDCRRNWSRGGGQGWGEQLLLGGWEGVSGDRCFLPEHWGEWEGK